MQIPPTPHGYWCPMGFPWGYRNRHTARVMCERDPVSGEDLCGYYDSRILSKPTWDTENGLVRACPASIYSR